MEYFQTVDSTPSASEESRHNADDPSQLYRQSDGVSSSVYTVKTQNASFQSQATTDALSSDQSRITPHPPKESIKLMPVKVKDIMEMLKTNPAYRDKSPVMINMKENDIDEIIEQQRYGNGIKLSVSPEHSLRQSPRISPTSVRRSLEEEITSLAQAQSPRSLRQSMIEEGKPMSRQVSDRTPGPSKPPLGDNLAPQVYAMTDIQAYPMIGSGGHGFRARKSKSRRKKPPRSVSRRSVSRKRISPNRRGFKNPQRNRIFRSKSRPRSRGRSRRRRSRPKKVRVQSRKRSPVVIVSKPRYPAYCTPFPLCDNECTTTVRTPTYTTSRPAIRPSRMSVACNCNLCQERLQFIQPGVCSKRKHLWTNEYAIIPKPQVNLIDPCEELDPSIYPRADNPCIRDGRGNPLTDCIGRPLRDPVGQKFLRFSANGSVLDTNFRGNFYSGQPPVCVKCPLPGASCAPDTTHNWWMNCGHPIQPNMNPYFQHIAAAENRHFWQ